MRAALALVMVAALSGAARAQSCPTGQMLCGVSHCTPVGMVCCASVGHEDLSCPAGSICQADGSCGSTCMAGWSSSLASCGGDTCGCSAPCAHHKDCDSTCCTTAGFCAPLCVCQGQGSLFLTCDKSGPAYGELPIKTGCSAAPGARVPSGGGWLAIGLGLAAATVRRRRASHLV